MRFDHLFEYRFIPWLGRFAAILGLALWIAYWIKIADHSRVLDANQATDPALPIA